MFPEFGSHSVARYDYRYGLPAVEEASSRRADLPDPVQGLRVVANPDNPQTKLDLTWSKLPDDPKGHPVMGYLVEVATDRDNDMSLATTATWSNLAIRDDSETTDVDEAKPWSVDKDTLTYTYDGSGYATNTDNETLAGGYVRWFRVIAITAENDGVATTGGQSVTPATGAVERTPTTETTPNTATQISALPAKGMTDAPAAPSDPSQVMAPPTPEDVTSEQASDTNLIALTDRGVLVLWNEPAEADDINAYIVQRKIGDDDWTPIARVTDRTSFTDSREYVDGEDLQYRVGSLGASSVPPSYTDPVMYPQTHPDEHKPSAPQMVTATADSATAVTVEWMAPADNGGSAITGFTVKWKMSSADEYAMADMAMAAADATMHQVTGLTANTSYDFQVIATNAEGSMGSDEVSETTQNGTAELGAPSGIMAEVSDEQDVMVTWTDGANARDHMVILFDYPSFEVAEGHIATLQDSGDTTFHDVPAGRYIVVVVALGSGGRYEFDHTEVVSVGQ